jgi:hypothetical protein
VQIDLSGYHKEGEIRPEQRNWIAEFYSALSKNERVKLPQKDWIEGSSIFVALFHFLTKYVSLTV